MDAVAIGTIRRFGNVEFDQARGTLRVSGRPVDIDRTCRAVLSVLLDHAGEEVSKQRLLEAGWPDRIVHENSLAKAIGRLRTVLGEQGEALEAVYGYGYKLDVRPETVAARAAPEVEPAVSPAPAADPGSRRPTILAAAAFVVALAVAGGAYLLDRPAAQPEPQFRSAPPVIADAPDAIGRVLWVDDNPQNNMFEERFFEERRIAVHTVRSSADARTLLSMYDYDVVISDMGRGEDRLAGIRLVEQMRADGDDTPYVIYTLRPDGEEQQLAQQRLVSEAGAQAVAVTPQEIRALILRLFGDPEPRSAG